MKNTKPLFYYLTYNEAYSGVYQSQIIDVVKFLNENFNIQVKLVALLPLRNFKKLSTDLKKASPDIITIPSFPKMKLWKMNASIILMLLMNKATAIIARNPIAANIALELKRKSFTKKVCIDMRGAFSDEFIEYLTKDNTLINLSIALEKDGISIADFRIFVTNKLANHYQKKINYNSTSHVIIPTTLDNSFAKELPSTIESSTILTKLGIPKNAVTIAFSGGSADWQSFTMIDEFYFKHLSANPNTIALILSKVDITKWKTMLKFPERVKQLFVKPYEVFDILSVCDYGLLLREKSITNEVASPTKCAEYLACGLPVIISKNIGDYSTIVQENSLGVIYENQVLTLTNVTLNDKQKMKQFAKENFFKNSVTLKYNFQILVDNLK